MNLLEEAQRFTKGAENAFAAGDAVAAIALLVYAAQCVQLAKAFKEMNDASQKLEALRIQPR